MNCSNPFMEYITILPMRVTGGPQGGLLLPHLPSVAALTPGNAAAVFTTLR